VEKNHCETLRGSDGENDGQAAGKKSREKK
jgi:hypothetical protein